MPKFLLLAAQKLRQNASQEVWNSLTRESKILQLELILETETDMASQCNLWTIKPCAAPASYAWWPARCLIISFYFGYLREATQTEGLCPWWATIHDSMGPKLCMSDYRKNILGQPNCSEGSLSHKWCLTVANTCPQPPLRQQTGMQALCWTFPSTTFNPQSVLLNPFPTTGAKMIPAERLKIPWYSWKKHVITTLLKLQGKAGFSIHMPQTAYPLLLLTWLGHSLGWRHGSAVIKTHFSPRAAPCFMRSIPVTSGLPTASI